LFLKGLTFASGDYEGVKVCPPFHFATSFVKEGVDSFRESRMVDSSSMEIIAMDSRAQAYYLGMADCANALSVLAYYYGMAEYVAVALSGAAARPPSTCPLVRGDVQEALAYYQWIADWQAALNGPTNAEVKLNLGCGEMPLAGFVNVDVVPRPGIEVADLREPWPWSDSSVDYVRAAHIIEHLPDKIFTMNELWRVLKPGGRADIEIPTTEGPGAWQDPTHVSFWNRRSFLYYEEGSPYREAYARSYGIQAKFRTVREWTNYTQDGPILSIILEAVKSDVSKGVVLESLSSVPRRSMGQIDTTIGLESPIAGPKSAGLSFPFATGLDTKERNWQQRSFSHRSSTNRAYFLNGSSRIGRASIQSQRLRPTK
jgi:SAM-dependent methyltransferase